MENPQNILEFKTKNVNTGIHGKTKRLEFKAKKADNNSMQIQL